MRFIGSKRLLVKNIDYVIVQNVKNHGDLKTFCDIFSGTTVVSQYFKEKYQIISNDLLYFSYCLQKSYIELNEKPKFEHLNIGSEIEEYINKSNYSEEVLYLKIIHLEVRITGNTYQKKMQKELMELDQNSINGLKIKKLVNMNFFILYQYL